MIYFHCVVFNFYQSKNLSLFYVILNCCLSFPLKIYIENYVLHISLIILFIHLFLILCYGPCFQFHCMNSIHNIFQNTIWTIHHTMSINKFNTIKNIGYYDNFKFILSSFLFSIFLLYYYTHITKKKVVYKIIIAIIQVYFGIPIIMIVKNRWKTDQQTNKAV